MEKILGVSNKILEVDLSSQSFKTLEISQQERTLFLGGKGLALKLMAERIQPGCDPLGKDNILIFAMGAIMGTGSPCSGRFSAVAKSPLTGIFLHSSCGGPFGMAFKTSGYDVLIIRGVSEKPVYLVINSQGVEFSDASELWGRDTSDTQNVLKEKGKGSLVIGPAGEHKVLYANIRSGDRFLGRGGLGAVMGSKNLKAVVAKGGEFKIEAKDKKKFEKARKRMNTYIKKNPITSGPYRNFGTSTNVLLSNKAGILPVRNFTGGAHPQADSVSGEYYKDHFNTTHHTCKPCSILCGHQGEFDGKKMAVPEYETIGLFGPNLDNFDPMKIAEWNERCGELGIDTISAAGTLAWVMEASEKGLYKSTLKFGNQDGITDILEKIAHRKGDGDDLAEGSKRLSEKYGGKEFAIQVKGLEMAAYDPRGCVGHGLSYAVANRGGCHLSSTLFVLESYFGLASPYAVRGKADMVKYFENVYAAVNSMHICQFTAFAGFFEPPLIKFSPQPVLWLLTQNVTPLALALMDISSYPDLWSSITGIPLRSSAFKKAGERIHVLERWLNTREGINRKDDTLPGRFLNEGRNCDPKNKTVPLEKLLNNYYKKRGYDENGIPTKGLLKRLGLEEVTK